MAYLPNQLPDDEQNKEQDGAPSGGQILGAPTGGSPASPGVGPAAPRGSNQHAAPLNIKSYGAKNQPAVQRLADQVGGSVRAQGDAARTAIQQGQQNFAGAVQGAEKRDDAGYANQILGDPTAITTDPSKITQVKALRDAEYLGPRALENTDFYQPVSQAIGTAKRAGEQLGTAGGRQELIARTTAPGQRISKGRLTLDEALLSGDANARTALQSAGDSLGDLDSRLAAASAASQARARQGADTTMATRDAIRGALTTGRQNFETDLDARLAAARTAAAERTAAEQQALKALSVQSMASKSLTPAQRADAQTWGAFNEHAFLPGQDTFNDQQLADLGLDREQISEILGKGDTGHVLSKLGRGITDRQERAVFNAYGSKLGDLSRFLTSENPDAAITRGNLATAGDYDRLAALNELADEQNTFLSPEERALAGTAPQNLNTLNFAGLSDAHRQALKAAQADSNRRAEMNTHNGGESFLKSAVRKFSGAPMVAPVASIVKKSPGGGQALNNYLAEDVFTPNRAYKDEEVL